jgi:hypothetical protein
VFVEGPIARREVLASEGSTMAYAFFSYRRDRLFSKSSMDPQKSPLNAVSLVDGWTGSTRYRHLLAPMTQKR